MTLKPGKELVAGQSIILNQPGRETGTMPKIRRALISVYDKEGIVAFARGLAELGVEIMSSGGTARLIRESGINVIEVSAYTGFPEMMDGRAKTLHPKVHGGLLARRDLPEPMTALETNAIENIDIGGPAMLRAAAKNHQSVTVVVDPADYEAVLCQLTAHGRVDPGL